MAEFFNLGLVPIVRLPSDSENDRESLIKTKYLYVFFLLLFFDVINFITFRSKYCMTK